MADRLYPDLDVDDIVQVTLTARVDSIWTANGVEWMTVFVSVGERDLKADLPLIDAVKVELADGGERS